MRPPLSVIEPWTWFFLPANLNPQIEDPNTDGSSSRAYEDDAEIDWSAVVRAANQAVAQAQEYSADQLEAGVLVRSVEVACPLYVSDKEAALLRAWVGDPAASDTGVMVTWDECHEEFRVMDGRHRLWGARRGTKRDVPRGLGFLTFIQRGGEVVIPVRDETISYAADCVAAPEEDWARAWVDSLDDRLRWWRVDGPLPARARSGSRSGVKAMSANERFMTGLASIKSNWPNVNRPSEE